MRGVDAYGGGEKKCVDRESSKGPRQVNNQQRVLKGEDIFSKTGRRSASAEIEYEPCRFAAKTNAQAGCPGSHLTGW